MFKSFSAKRSAVLAAAVFFGLLVGNPLAAQSSSDIFDLRNGHTGTVRFFAASPGGTYAASYGTDGLLLVWNLEQRRLERRIPLSEGSVFKLTLNPRGTRAALIISPGTTSFRLVEYNLETGSRLFSSNVPNLPLTLAYSEDGEVIFASNPEINSLRFYESGNGRSKRGFSQGFGIVDSASVSSDGGSLFSYQAAQGLITYHRLSNFQELARIQTLTGLQSIQLFSNKRYALARAGSSVYIIDVVTGAMRSNLTADSLSSAILVSDQLVALLRNVGARPSIQWVQIDGATFGSRSAEIRIDVTAQLVAAKDSTSILFVNQAGSLSTISAGDTLARAFATPRLFPMRSALVNDEFFFIATDSGLNYFRHGDALPKLSLPNRSTVSNSALHNVPLPFGGAPGILQLSDGRVLVWNLAAPGPIFELTASLTFREISPQRQQTVTRIRDEGQYLVLFYADERVELVRAGDFTTVLTYSNLALSDALVAGDDYLIVTGSRSSGFGSSLLRLDLRTRETTPLVDEGILFYALEHSDQNSGFIALGVTTGDSSQSNGTKLYEYTLRNGLFTGRQVTSFTVQDNAASIVRSGAGTIVSVAENALTLIQNNGRRLTFGGNTRRQHSLTLLQSYVASVNADGSLSFWDANSRSFTGNLAQLSNGTAVLLGPNRNLVFLVPEGTVFVPTKEFLSELLLADERAIEGLRFQSTATAPAPTSP